MLTNLLILAFALVFIIDISGAIDSLKRFLWRFAYKGGYKPFKDFNLKPIDCSLCATFWVGTIYLIFTEFTLPYFAYVVWLSFMTPIIKDMMLFVRDFFTKLIDTLYQYFQL